MSPNDVCPLSFVSQCAWTSSVAFKFIDPIIFANFRRLRAFSSDVNRLGAPIHQFMRTQMNKYFYANRQ
jgi:hypothetical protein